MVANFVSLMEGTVRAIFCTVLWSFSHHILNHKTIANHALLDFVRCSTLQQLLASEVGLCPAWAVYSRCAI